MIVGTPKTLYIGFFAGIVGVTIGTALFLIASGLDEFANPRSRRSV